MIQVLVLQVALSPKLKNDHSESKLSYFFKEMSTKMTLPLPFNNLLLILTKLYTTRSQQKLVRTRFNYTYRIKFLSSRNFRLSFLFFLKALTTRT